MSFGSNGHDPAGIGPEFACAAATAQARGLANYERREIRGPRRTSSALR